MKNSFLLLTLLFSMMYGFVSAQESFPSYNKNYIYLDGGLTLGAFGGIAYERILLDKVKWNTISIAGGVGYNSMLLGSDAYYEGPYANVKANLCLRAKSHNFELGLGACLLLPIPENSYVPKTVKSITLPDVSIGYKFQKPGKKFLFKTSVGYPKLWAVGLGCAF
jgi:hypothetical protein